MTEYQIADLALSTQAIYWQQAQTSAAVVDSLGVIIDRFTTLLFGYIVVAYFVGKNLTRVQVTILTALYLVWQVRLMAITFTMLDRMERISVEMSKLDAETPGMPGSSTVVMATITIACTLASVYFMWNVRRPKTE